MLIKHGNNRWALGVCCYRQIRHINLSATKIGNQITNQRVLR
jgi:hypothetical protein